MKKFLVATLVLALAGWDVVQIGAKPAMTPLSYDDGQPQVMIDEQTLDAYHDEMARFYSNSADLRHEIWGKVHLFATLLTNPETSKAEILAIQQEIQVMTNELQSKELSFRWDLNSQFPGLATDKYRGCLGAATGTRGPGR
ncbi:MAG: hypothetical protein ABFS18_03890 [Thermodesulfobacteriota bacterium]